MKRLLPVCGFLLMFFVLKAQVNPLEADRPDQTETPSIVPAGYFQFETGFVFEKDHEDGTLQKNFTCPTILAKYGISKRVELRLILENVYLASKQSVNKTEIKGFAPLQFGFKVNICKEKGILPATSLIMHVAIPKVASKDLQADHTGYNFRFTMQHTLSEKISMGYNLGAEWDGMDAHPAGAYTVTTGFKLSEKFGAYAELFGFLPQQATAAHSMDAGITFLPGPNIMFDISAGFGLNKYAPDYFAGCGFSIRLHD